VVDDISLEGLRSLLAEEGVSFQRLKIWKTSTDPDFEPKKDRRLELYALTDGERPRRPGDPDGGRHGPPAGSRTASPTASTRHLHPVELAYTPRNASWLNRIEAQFTALRYFTLDGTDHASHDEQSRMIRRYIVWRNRHANDQQLQEIINRANVA
jgi:hypothetical protein